ncbi:MAG: hypothetical protein P1S46_01165 [bacterium]|nr:hypothetical protein [bacterium]MDT8396802.1 hypothetical protein [bacterium]
MNLFPLSPTLSSFGKLRTVSLSNQRESEERNDYISTAPEN